MFYRAFTGWHGSDIGLPDDAIPGMNDGDQTTTVDSMAPMQAWNMTHFKLAYKTLYWNPVNESTYLSDETKYSKEWRAVSYKEGIDRKEQIESDGIDNNRNGEIDEKDEGGIVNVFHGSSVFFLKYYHGAIVKGQVKTAPVANQPDSTGRPVPGARITVHDEFSIPHDVVYTDENGFYEITVPSGEISLWVSKDGRDETKSDTAILLLDKTLLNRTDLSVTEDQAERKVSNYIINKDIRIEPGSLNGTIYWDKNGNDVYDTNTELPVEGIELVLYDPNRIDAKSPNERKQYVLKSVTDKNGKYRFDRIIPGTYRLESKIAGHNITFAQEILITLDDPQSLLQVVDYPVKPSALKGMVKYFNEIPAEDIDVKIIDETNDREVSAITLPNGTFVFSDLLSGNYTMIVEETGFEKIEKRVEVAEDFVNETEIILRPITPVSGYVWNDKDGNDILDAGEKLANARITFFNQMHRELNTVIFTNQDGDFSGNLTAGNYTGYVKYQIDDEKLAGTARITVYHQTTVQTGLNIKVGPSFKVSGILTKLINDTVEGALIKFINKDDSTTIPAPTNLSGYYEAYLPPGNYEWRLKYIDLGTNYSYVKDFQIVDQGYELDVNVLHATLVQGTIFWDRNSDGNFTSYWFDTPSTGEDYGNEEIPPDDLQPQTRQDNGEEPPDFADAEPFRVKESLENVTVKFTNENGTIRAISNYTGIYDARIPAGEYSVSIDDPRFKSIDTTMPAEKLSFKVAPPAPTNPPNIYLDILLEPRPVTLSGTIWFDENENGELDEDESVPDVKIVFTNISYGADMYETVTDENGHYTLSVVPGVYDIEINQSFGNGIRYSYIEENYTVPFKESSASRADATKDFKIDKYILVEYTAELDGNPLPGSELVSENTTIHIYDGKDNEVIPIAVDDIALGGYIKPGMYSIWLEYFSEGENYVFLGDHNVKSGTREYNIDLVKGLRINGTIYNDTKNFGVIDISEWLTKVNLKFKPGEGGGLIVLNVSTGIYSVYVKPGLDYDITLDNSKNELINNKEVNIRYIFEKNLYIDKYTSLDIETVRYINISGILFYNIFETKSSTPRDFSTTPGQIDDGEDLGKFIDNADIIFTQQPVLDEPVITAVKSNTTGAYYAHLRDRVKYTIEITRHGFDTKPKTISSFLVTEKNATFNIQAKASAVTVSGRLYSTEDNKTVTGNVHLEFILNYKGIDTKYNVNNIKDGHYSIDLVPEKYTVYAYTEGKLDQSNISARIYRSLTRFDTAEFNISEDKTLDLGLLPGVKVYGLAYYTDSDGVKKYDVYQNNKKEEGGIKFENMITSALKFVDINNSDYWIYLPYGEYNVATSLITREYDMNMTYELDKVITVTNTSSRTNFELEKRWDYRFDFSLEQEDRTMTIADGSTAKFEFLVKNNGNDKNTIKFSSPATPDGWVVKFNSEKITLNITEEKRISATVKTVPGSYYDNTVDFKAESQNNAAITQTETMEIHIPAQYNFRFYTEVSPTFGINYDEVLEIPLAIQNLGNAGDSITLVGPKIPPAWNVTIEDPDKDEPLTIDMLGEVSYRQSDSYKNLTLRITGPNETTGHMIGEKLLLNLFAKSTNGQKTQSLQLEAVLDLPDLKVLSMEIANLRLEEPGRNNITVNATVSSVYASASNVMVSLFVDGKSIANKTYARLSENAVVKVKLSYELASSDKGEHNIQVFVDPDNTIVEKNEFNNDISRFDIIGPLAENEEVNWRPYIFLSGLVIFLVILYVYIRWRRKI